MTRAETIDNINSMIAAANTYQSSINSLKGELESVGESATILKNSINNGINMKVLLDYALDESENIKSSIGTIISLIDSAVGTLNEDVRNKVRELVDTYNSQNNRLEKDKREEYLSYGDFSI